MYLPDAIFTRNLLKNYNEGTKVGEKGHTRIWMDPANLLEQQKLRQQTQPLLCTGQVRSGQVRSGQVRSGQVRSGQVRSGQVRSGQVRVRSGQGLTVSISEPDATFFELQVTTFLGTHVCRMSALSCAKISLCLGDSMMKSFPLDQVKSVSCPRLTLRKEGSLLVHFLLP